MKCSLLNLVALFGRGALHRLGILIAIALLIAGAAPAAAADPAPSDQWEIGLEVYLWGASIGGTTATGDDLDISFTDLLSDLDMGLMSALGARKGNWSVIGDVIYLDVSEEDSTTANLIGNPIKTSVDVELTGWVVTLAGGYTVVRTERAMLDVVFGGRYLELDTDLEFDIGAMKVPFSESGHVWDAIIGVRGKADFAKEWYFSTTSTSARAIPI